MSANYPVVLDNNLFDPRSGVMSKIYKDTHCYAVVKQQLQLRYVWGGLSSGLIVHYQEMPTRNSIINEKVVQWVNCPVPGNANRK